MNRLLTEHFKYLSDPAKLRAYGKAIAAVVRDGDVVLRGQKDDFPIDCLVSVFEKPV